MSSRRQFLQQVGAVAIAPAVKVKKHPDVQRFLTQKFNEFMKGQKWDDDIKIYASPKLYDAYESSLVTLQRYTDKDETWKQGYPNLCFKSSRMYRSTRITGLKGYSMIIAKGGKSVQYDLSVG